MVIYKAIARATDMAKQALLDAMAYLSRNWATINTNIDIAARSMMSVLKLVVVAYLFALFALDPSFLRTWFGSVTHAEAFGAKLQRTVEVIKTQADSIRVKKSMGAIGEAAIVRAARAKPAISGANVLWVDDTDNDSNQHEIAILRELGIKVDVEKTTDDAMRALKRLPYDLIISDIHRRNEKREPLSKCGVHYFEVPRYITRNPEKYKDREGLRLFNEEMNRESEAGFGMLEKIALSDGRMRPPIIFYSGSHAGTVASRCAPLITNDPERLLQWVVSALEEVNWRKLTTAEGTTSIDR